MKELQLVGFGQRMSSREIARLTEKRHDHVLRDIRALIDGGALGLPNFGESNYTDSQGKSQPEYLLDFDATMTLITGYNPVLRAKVIRRWRELEERNLPRRKIEYVEAYLAELKRNEALEREKKELEVKLDESMEWYSIKRMEKLNPGQNFKWQLLKNKSREMGIPIKKTFDQNYGEVNVYHKDVWEALFFDTLDFE